jgi:hypothetical protein|tara:strand:+ start:278 stop:625 length:348 start_codon:yes stop_codon:yes gene_type:complete
MAKKGLRSWVNENWVDIANKKSDGSYPKCGRSGGEKRKKYPKCVPIAKARAMSKGQKASAVSRKQKAGNTGPKPSNVATIKKAGGGYIGPNMSGSYDGVELSNPSYRSYYAGRKM